MAVQGCEQVIDPGLANTLANAMSKDDQPGGTAAAAAASARWSLPMSGKTGTTEANRSSGFLGFTLASSSVKITRRSVAFMSSTPFIHVGCPTRLGAALF